ncbi:MFS transporter [Corynebacterium hylobatis]|uniref:MFS transporter n=1 Tax=Corynebacterium hylobatis TaxID=1859290 RepID=UPI0013DF9EF9|nr:MFS transporter [Corynebacterium hylobatis]
MPAETIPGRGGGRLAVGALVFASLVAGLLQSIVLQIQDELPALLGSTREVTGWIVTATILAACAFSPVSSRLGDMLGRKRVTVSLLMILALGSAVAALAPNVWIVILGRALQGLAIGVIPLAMSILKDIVPPARLGGAIALTSGTLGIGSAVGLPLGALVNEYASWRGIFWVCFFLAVLSTGWVQWAVPAHQVRSHGDFDALGALGLGLSVTVLLIGLAQSLPWGWDSVATLATFGVGAVSMAATIAHLWRRSHPIIDVRSSLAPRVLLTNISALLMNFSMMGAIIVFPQLMALPADAPAGLGIDRVLAGLIMMTSGVTTALATPLITSLNARFGPKRLMVAGTFVVGVCLGLGLVAPWSAGLFLGINIGLGFGFGMSFAAMPQIIMESVDRRDTAAANGLNAQLRFFGTAAASAILAAVLAHWSIGHHGVVVPTVFGVELAIVLCSAAAFVATVLCLFIPTAARS